MASVKGAAAETGTEAGAQTGTEATTTTSAGTATGSALGHSGHKASGTSPAEVARVDCLMNARYHASREAFLDTVHRWFMFAVIGLGAAAILDLAPHGWSAPAKECAAALAAMIAAADLAFDLSNRARAHSLMKRRYFELLADLQEGAKTAEQALACAHRYSADEEPAFHALLASSWNAAQEMEYGDAAHAYAIPGTHLFWKNLRRYSGEKYQIRKAHPQPAL